jgi:hypothetical protein
MSTVFSKAMSTNISAATAHALDDEANEEQIDEKEKVEIVFLLFELNSHFF